MADDEPYLPEHIIHHIFLRMPTKPLFRLKSLSKHWDHVISDPKFIKSRSRRMTFLPSIPFHAIDNTAQSMIKLFSPMINPKSYTITIVGSFNGILLLVLTYRNPVIFDQNHRMILYNPLSGEVNAVPHPQSYDLYSDYVYGFGYGTTINDLKIVRIEDKFYGDSKSYDIFTLKTWSWSRPSELIGDYCLFTSNPSGTYANGNLYWKVKRKTNNIPLILAFDIKKMLFLEIEIPGSCWLNRLGTYNGRLCMICSQLNVKGYKLMVMNEHGFGESWSTLCSFGSSCTLLFSYTYAYGMLCILDDGKLLVLTSLKDLIIYDMFKDSYEEVNGLTSFFGAGNLEAVEYVESTVSPSDICYASI